MSLERRLAAACRNFSTYALIVAVVVAPLHLVYSVAFSGVVATTDIHADIASLPPGEAVRGVTAESIRTARTADWVVTGLIVLSLPLMLRATRAALATEAAGRLPAALPAWRAALRGRERGPLAPGAAAAVALLSAAVWLAVWWAGSVVTEVLPAGLRFAGWFATRTLAWCLALPWMLVAAAAEPPR